MLPAVEATALPRQGSCQRSQERLRGRLLQLRQPLRQVPSGALLHSLQGGQGRARL